MLCRKRLFILHCLQAKGLLKKSSNYDKTFKRKTYPKKQLSRDIMNYQPSQWAFHCASLGQVYPFHLCCVVLKRHTLSHQDTKSTQEYRSSQGSQSALLDDTDQILKNAGEPLRPVCSTGHGFVNTHLSK